MGLDITAYRQLKPAPKAKMEDGCVVEWDRFAQFSPAVLAFTEQNWPGHSGGIVAGVYSFAEAHRFRAGSYSGYSYWRDQLSQFAHGKSASEFWGGEQTGPFAELINFADNEGIIGPKVAAKLAKDFADLEESAVIFSSTTDDEAWWLISYHNWQKAFEMAADNGAVELH